MQLIHSQRMVTPHGIVAGGLVIEDGWIIEVIDDLTVERLQAFSGAITDFGECYLLPGVIDSHVHVNQPGCTDWEGIELVSRAAAAGGITTIVDMPLNSSPVTISRSALEAKQRSVQHRTWIDLGFHGGVVGAGRGGQPASSPAEVEALIEAGVMGIKVFLCDSGLDEFPPVTPVELEWLMPLLAKFQVPLWVHAEIVPSDWRVPPVIQDYRPWSEVRSQDFEEEAIAQLIELCRRYACPTHIVHLSHTRPLNKIRRAKREGLPLTVETCPHYLCFAEEDIPPRDPRFRCCPPIRDRQNQHRLWDALELGEIDTLGSDHSPRLPEMKMIDHADFATAWGGIASLQLLLPVMWDAAQQRQLPISRLVECLSSRPAELLGLSSIKGSLEPGRLADIVVFDPDQRWTIHGRELLHRHKLTPYEGRSVQGQVVRTYLAGTTIFDAGTMVSPPLGRPLRRGMKSTC